MLTEQVAGELASRDHLMRARQGLQLLVLIVALLTIASGIASTPTRSNFVRIILGPLSSVELAVPAERAGALAATGMPGSGAAEARRLNAAIPFAPNAGVPAQPFLLASSTADRERAVDCLALAAMAEAGEGDDGQRAVIQVILNRVRHPAFAKTVCGVVFEGSHRSTGCQFTFTCDGALARRHSADAWARARIRAIDAIAGRVYSPVGMATHYHTDWVHPYWSASLLKLARVDTHLFFRWRGYAGSAANMNVAYRGGEPAMAQLAYRFAHAEGAGALPLHDVDPAIQIASTPTDVVVRNADGGAFVLLTGGLSADGARDMGRSVCAGRSSCKVFGWFDRGSIPSGYPVPTSARAKLGFSYFRSSSSSETVLYDCKQFGTIPDDRCLPPPARSRPKMPADFVVEAGTEKAPAMMSQNGPMKLSDTSLRS